MLIFKRDAVLEALAVLLLWVGSYEFFNFILAGSPTTSNYSFISAWWLAAYVFSKYEIKVEALLIVFAFSFTISFGAACFGMDWFYKDITELSYLESAVISLSHALIIVSPWIFNLMFTQGQAFLSKHGSHRSD